MVLGVAQHDRDGRLLRLLLGPYEEVEEALLRVVQAPAQCQRARSRHRKRAEAPAGGAGEVPERSDEVVLRFEPEQHAIWESREKRATQ